jgi:hypothetical protein
VKLWNDLRGWAGANAAALRLCFRMTVAGLLAYVLAEFFALPQGYWAVFSAIIVMQASVGGSVKATIDRVIGTIGGAVAGGAVGYIVPQPWRASKSLQGRPPKRIFSRPSASASHLCCCPSRAANLSHSRIRPGPIGDRARRD